MTTCQPLGYVIPLEFPFLYSSRIWLVLCSKKIAIFEIILDLIKICYKSNKMKCKLQNSIMLQIIFDDYLHTPV